MKKVVVVLVLIVILAIAATAAAFSQTHYGTLSAASPTFNRPFATCSGLSGATDVFYDTYNFVAPETTLYNIDYSEVSISDTYLLVYEGSFDPANPLTNCYVGNDDSNFTSGLISQLKDVPMTEGTTYVIVTTTFSNGDTGSYAVTISADGDGVAVPNKGEIMIGAGAPVQTYGAAGAFPTNLVLPADYDGNGFDTYTVTGTATVAGETWYSIFVGGPTTVWVPANQVTVLR